MSFSANLTLSNGPDNVGGSVDDVLTLALSGNPTVVQWYVAVGQVTGQPTDLQLTPLSGLPTASGSTVPRAAVQSAILAASPAPVGLWGNPLSVWVRADDDNVISNTGDTTPGVLATFGAETPGGLQALKVERTAGAGTPDTSDDMFQVTLGGGIAYDHRIDVLLKPASGSGNVAPLTNAATFQVPMITGTQTPMASASYTGSQIYNAVMQKYASVYSNPDPNDPVVAGFRVTAMGGPPNAKFAVAQFDVLPTGSATLGAGYAFGIPELSNGGTVLARNDDKISFSMTLGDAGVNSGNAPGFRVVPLQKLSGNPVELTADASHTTFTLNASNLAAASIVKLSVLSGYYTLGEISLPMPAGQAVSAASIAAVFSQSTAANGPFASVTASGDALQVVLQQGVPTDSEVIFTPLTYQRPYGFTDTDSADLLTEAVSGIEVVAGTDGVSGAVEVQKITLPTTVVAGAKYALKLGYSNSSIEFSPSQSTHQGLLNAANAALAAASYSPVSLSLGTGDDSNKMLVTFAYSGPQEPVQFGKVVPLLPTYNTATQRFELTRPAIEASMDFMNVGSVDAFEVQATPPAGSTSPASPVLLIPLPELEVVLSAEVESGPGYFFAESDPDPVFTVRLAQPLAEGEQLLFRVVPPLYSSVSMGAASADDFDLTLVNDAPQGSVTFPPSSPTIGSFTLPIKADAIVESMEGFELQIGHIESGQFVVDMRKSGLMIAQEGSNNGGGSVTPSNDMPSVLLASPEWSGSVTADNFSDDHLTLQVSGSDISDRSSYEVAVIGRVYARVPTGVPVVTQGDTTHAESVVLPLPASGVGESVFVLQIGNMEFVNEMGPSATAPQLAAAFDSQVSGAGLGVSVDVVPPTVGSSSYQLKVTWDALGDQPVDVSLARQSVQDGPGLYLRAGDPVGAAVQTQGSDGVAEVQTFVLTGPVSLAANTAYGLAVPHGPMLVAITDASPTVDEVVASWTAKVPVNAPVALTAANNTLTLTWTQPGAVEGVASVGALAPLTANAEASISRMELINAVKQSQVYGLAGLKILVSELADSDGANESTSIVAPLPPPLVSYITGPTQASEGSTVLLTVNFAAPVPVTSQIMWQAQSDPYAGAGFSKSDIQGTFTTDWPRGMVSLTPSASNASFAESGTITLAVAADSVSEAAEGLMVQAGVMNGTTFIADGYAHPILIGADGAPSTGLLPALLDRTFLKVPGAPGATVSTDAVSNNGTPNDPTDDQMGRVSLDGTEKVTVAVGPITAGDGLVSLPIGTANDEAYALALLPDGKIAVAGRSTQPVAYGGANAYVGAIALLNPDGSLAPSFSTDGIALSSVGQFKAIAVMGNAIVAVGEKIQGNYNDITVVKFDLAGNPISDFGANGVAMIPVTVGDGHDTANAVAIQADGSILVAGQSNATGRMTETTLVRLTPNGTPDASFGNQGKVVVSLGVAHDGANSINLLPDGSMIVGGPDFNNNRKTTLLKFGSNGVLDSNFGVSGKVVTPIYDAGSSFVAEGSVALQGDKILVSGTDSDGSSQKFQIARFNADGSPDTGFGVNGVVVFNGMEDAGNAIAVQPDGKIVVAGGTITYRTDLNGYRPEFTVTRLSSDGQLDTSFSGDGKYVLPATPFGSYASQVLIDSANRIVVAGSLGHTNQGTFDFAVLRLLPDGSPDPDFDRPPAGSVQLPANADQLFSAITNATSAEAFASAVSAAKQSLDVRFWVDKGSANIDSDATLEPNVQALLNYVAPTSGQNSINFASVGVAPTADTARPVSTSVSFSNTTVGSSTKSAITLRFSEEVGINGAANPTSTQIDALKAAIVVDLAPPQDGHSNQAGGTPIQIVGIAGFGTSTLTLSTDINLQAESIIRVKFPDFTQSQFPSQLTDLSGNQLSKGEVWAGGSGNSTIELDGYFSDAQVTLRGNSGNDFLIGTGRSDIFVDGDGLDTINGGAGQDYIVLHESSLSTGSGNFARDVVEISLGQSVNGGGGTRRDHIQPSATNPTTSGFDIVSPVDANHDVLSLPSARIAANTTTDIDGVDNANSGAEVTIGKHSVADGIITFKTNAGAPILIQTSQQVTDAMEYLWRNFAPTSSQPGTTVAFKYDRDANDIADSLFIYQQPGQAKVGLTAPETMPPTSVLVRDLIGIGSVKLGSQAAPNTLQLIDTQMPEPINIGMVNGTNSTLQIGLDFAEPVTVSGSGGATLKVGGITPISGTLASTNGTSQLLINLPATVLSSDWVLLNMDTVVPGSNAIVDGAGNILQPDEMYLWGGIALGGPAANSINLGNSSIFPSNREYEIDSGGGNDTIVGSAGNDDIRGGEGADSITSASGNDRLSFVQGDSPTVTLNKQGNTVVSFSFSGSVPEVVTDFSVSDEISLRIPFADMKNVGGLSPTPSSGASYIQGVMPSDGLVPDEQFFVVRGTLGSAGVFALSDSGADSLVVYDAGVNTTLSQSAFVLAGVTPEQLAIYSGGIGRVGEDAPPPPVPPTVDAVPLNTWLSFTETASGPVKSTLTFRVNEPLGINGQLSPAPTLVEAWRQSVRVDLNPPQDGPAPSSAETVSGVRVQVTAVNGFQPNGSSELVLTTDRNLSATDVVRMTFPRDAQQAQAALTDVGGNPFVGVEVWAGGTGANTIDLDGYFSDRAVWVRGNSGNDTLVGTRAADWLIDEFGADTLQGGTGADVLVLTEGGLNATGVSNGVFSRDVVRVGWGESVTSQSSTFLRDVIAPGSLAGSGFDIVSGTATQDVLSLPSASIAASTNGFVSGVANTNAERALSISAHRIDAGGRVVFKNTAGVEVLPSTSQQVTDALVYLSQSLAAAGTTVAFAFDRDQSGVADSLVLFQRGAWVSAGAPAGEGYRLPGTVVLIRDLVGIDGATLGTSPGHKVVQIVDQLAPDVAQIALAHDASPSISIDFTEPIVVEGNAGITLRRNGLTALDFSASTQGGTSLRLSISSALNPTDWVLLEADQAGPGNGFHDQAGNAITDTDGAEGGIALGGAGNDVIDLGGSAFSATDFFSIVAGAGDDTITGSAGDTAINGGRGADLIAGGTGRDEFEFIQGDSPTVTVALQADKPASFAFVGGADVITDLSPGERVSLGVVNQDLRGLDGLRPMGEGALAFRGEMPDSGLVADESYFVVRGSYSMSGASAVFNVGIDSGPDTLIVYDGASGASISQTGLVLQGVTPDGLNTFVGGVSALADQSGEYQGEEVQRGSDGPDTLEGAGSDDRVLLGAGGDDLARGLGEGDVFVGGLGTDTAQLPGAPSDYVVKLASPGLRDTIRMLSPDTYQAGQPLFAVQNKIASSGMVLIQAEWLKFGNDSANVDPMTLVGGGGILVVNSAVANAFSSVAAAIAAANAGSTIFVSPTHIEPAGVGPIIVTKDDLHVVLDNAGSSPLNFQLAEINSVRSLSLFGTGEASIIGNGFDNTLIGNEGSNWIDGRGGNDRLLGQGGDDDLYGGAGDDWLDGGDGFDRLMAGAGRDVLIAFDAQDDALPAGATVGEVNGDVMLGGSGNDILIAMNSGSGVAPIRMMGGSGSDVFRISNPNGASGSVDQVNESIPQAVRAFIADLTPADGLDLSALRTNAQGGGAVTAMPTGAAVAGDYRVPLDGLFVAGLQSVLEATAGAGGSVPIDPISEGSFLTAALVGPVEMNAALARSIPAPSTQDLVEQVLPSVYGPLEAFIDQLYV